MKNAKWWLMQLFAITLYRKLKYTLWYQKACGSWLVHLERGLPSTPFLPSIKKERIK